MNLHKNHKEFYDTLLVVADKLNTSPAIIEKYYQEITQKVLFEQTTYDTAISALYKIIKSGVFEN